MPSNYTQYAIASITSCPRCHKTNEVMRVRKNWLIRLLLPKIKRYQCKACGNHFYQFVNVNLPALCRAT